MVSIRFSFKYIQNLTGYFSRNFYSIHFNIYYTFLHKIIEFEHLCYFNLKI
jgi:hypothetical protein